MDRGRPGRLPRSDIARTAGLDPAHCLQPRGRPPEAWPPLVEFVAALRGSLNQLLADSLTLPPAAGPAPAVELRLVASRKVKADRSQSVATTPPAPDPLPPGRKDRSSSPRSRRRS